jgi:predicted butyrate kinase (DUF1464 family)
LAKLTTKSRIAATLAHQVDIPRRASAAYLDALAALAQRHRKNALTIPGVGRLVRVNQPRKKQSRQKALIDRIGRSPLPSLQDSAKDLGLSTSRARHLDSLVERALGGQLKTTRPKSGQKKK